MIRARAAIFFALTACVSFERFVQEDTSVSLLPLPCTNGELDPGEEGIDCGGECPACPCEPETDSAFCARQGKTCGVFSGVDNCGETRDAAACGTCVAPEVCMAGACCTPESDAVFCARMSASCGSKSGTDNCGVARSVTSCGSCAPLSVVSCQSGACVCSATPETERELCDGAQRTCGAFQAVDRCGATRMAQCGTCPGGRACLPNGDCEPLCPALPATEPFVEASRVWVYDGAGSPRWLELDSQRGIIQAANSDFSTLFIQFAGNPFAGSSCGYAGGFYFLDWNGGGYTLVFAGYEADFTAMGFAIVHDETFTLAEDGNTVIGPKADRTGFLQRMRTSPKGVTGLTWGPTGSFGSIVDTNVSRGALSPDGSLFFYLSGSARKRSDRVGGDYPTGVDVTTELTAPWGHTFTVDSITSDNLSFVASGPAGQQLWRRPNRWSSFGVVGNSGDTMNGFRLRASGDCSSFFGTCEGGCANERPCFFRVANCVPESDAELCARTGFECQVDTYDACQRERSVNCGTCAGSDVCALGGICVEPTPASPTITMPAAPSPDPTGVFEAKMLMPMPGGADVLVDDRFFLMGITPDAETMLVKRKCAADDVYFADRVDPVLYRYRLQRVASTTEMANAGIFIDDAFATLTPDGRTLVTLAATRDRFVQWTRPSKTASLVFAATDVRVHRGFMPSPGGVSFLSSPVFSPDGRFMSYAAASPSTKVFLAKSTAGGFFRNAATDITAQLNVSAVQYVPTGISADNLTLFTTPMISTQGTYVFRRPDINSAFAPVGAPTAFAGQYARTVFDANIVFAMRSGLNCDDARIVVNTVGP